MTQTGQREGGSVNFNQTLCNSLPKCTRINKACTIPNSLRASMMKHAVAQMSQFEGDSRLFRCVFVPRARGLYGTWRGSCCSFSRRRRRVYVACVLVQVSVVFFFFIKISSLGINRRALIFLTRTEKRGHYIPAGDPVPRDPKVYSVRIMIFI